MGINLTAEINNNYIEIIKYPFKCSHVCKNRIITTNYIIEVAKSFLPPVIRTIANELIFISAEMKTPLLDFCMKNNLPVVSRLDIWSAILDPFLDTEHSDKYKKRSINLLNDYGITVSICDDLRKEVARRMIAYNFESCLWEWGHLGFFDVLCASCGILSGEKYRLPDDKFSEFYFRSMEIALKCF